MMSQTAPAARAIPAPTPSPETQHFWDQASHGKFVLPSCDSCGKTHWYPRRVCPHCFGDCSNWTEASGIGTIYSYSVMRRAPEPYAIAYVTLAEGPTMLTNIVGCDFSALRIGLPVRLAWVQTQGGPPVPCFTPA
jgi:uncharacterized OB-fold protein